MRTKINRVGMSFFLYFSWRWLYQHEVLADWLNFLINLFFIFFGIWFLSRLFRQVINVCGINLLQKTGIDNTEILLALEMMFNIGVGLIALTILVSRYGVSLNTWLTSLSLTGIALSFAAQNILQQLLGTVILLLDKPCIRGEYIRLPDDTFGRVESIGLRSTKIRTAAKNTLVIMPNSKMAESKIENVTRGKKVMILVYLDFEKVLNQYEKSLVSRTIIKHNSALLSIEPDTSNITFLHHPDREVSRARITFFILGSTESSIDLRKQIIRISQTQLSQELATYGITYTTHEPAISFDSPISL
ncbi:MAG TPA: mechanosensitive ion channel domain-containing protein [Coleofasciculaceae cyanobacterium]